MLDSGEVANERLVLASIRLPVDVDEEAGVIVGETADEPCDLAEVPVGGDDVGELHVCAASARRANRCYVRILAVAADVTIALPPALVAVTRARSLSSTSARVATYVLAVAPAIAVHELSAVVEQRSH